MTEDEIVRANEGLVHVLTRRYKSRNDYDEILQEARIGVVQAIRKYDKERSAFSTYAAHWIRARVSRYFMVLDERAISLDEPQGEAGTELIDTIWDPNENGELRAEASMEAEALLVCMPEPISRAYRMQGKGYTLQYIADTMGCTRQNVQSMLKRYSEKIRREE